MFGMGLSKTSRDSIFESVEGIIILGVKTFLFDKFPQPFNQVQIWRVRRQEQQFNIKYVSHIHNQVTTLVASIIQNKGNRVIREQ